MASSSDELLRLANQAHVAGKLTEAESLAHQVLASEPNNGSANLLAGVLAGKTGRNDLAVSHLEKTLAVDPSSFEALFWLSMLARRKKDLTKAADYAERVVRLRPSDPHGQNNLGLCYLEMARLEEAVKAFRQAASARADLSPIFHNLGTALHLLGKEDEARAAFERALTLSPQSVESHLSLGQVYLMQDRPAQAIESARRALALDPKAATAHLLMAGALVEESRTGEAQIHMEKAVALNPQDAQAHALLGQRYQSLGRFREANEHLKRSMELEPRQGFAYFAYVHNNKVSEADRPMVEKMEALVESGGLNPRDLDFLHYGLGRSLETLGEYEKAMGHYDEANRLARQIKFGNRPFDRKAYAAIFDRLIQAFDRDFIERNQGVGLPSEQPILIVGMMRSGTTLVEQMLSAHPKIRAAGEQRYWLSTVPTLFAPNGPLHRPEVLRNLAEKYLEILRKAAPGSERVTDKMPANYELLGPIHIALPNVRIIHMKRHPVDTCLSIYATPNRIPVDYAFDRDNIVFAYEQYLRLMDHWRRVLPESHLIEVSYENVVEDPESQARRILKGLGLEWNDAVLRHEHNERTVLTPSLWQVRQPMYTTSVERWRRFEPWLGGFRNLLVDENSAK